MNKIKALYLVIIVIILNGCGVTLLDEAGRPGMLSPKPLFLKNLPQDESSYSIGFRDGCYNFIGQNGYGMSRYYDREVNPDGGLLEDELYQQGYRHGDRYCGVYVNKGIIL